MRPSASPSTGMRRAATAIAIVVTMSAGPVCGTAYAQAAPPVPQDGIARPPGPGGSSTTPRAEPTRPDTSAPTAPASAPTPAAGGDALPIVDDRAIEPFSRSSDTRPLVDVDQLQSAWSYRVPGPEQTGLGVKDLEYDTGVVPLVLRPYITTLVSLEACEHIDRVFLGDPGLFVVAIDPALPHVVALQPEEVGVDTSLLLVAKSGRQYSFYLQAVAVDAPVPPDVRVSVQGSPQPFCGARAGGMRNPLAQPAAAFAPSPPGARARSAQPGERETGAISAPPGFTPPPPGGAPIDAAHSDYLARVPTRIQDLRFDDYRVLLPEPQGAAIQPVRVFHDGIYTYIDFGEKARSMRLPAAALVQDEIDIATVQTTLGDHGEILVVKGVGDISLKSGRLYVCLVFDPPDGWWTRQASGPAS